MACLVSIMHNSYLTAAILLLLGESAWTEFWPSSLVGSRRRHIIFSELQDLFFVPDRLWTSSLPLPRCQSFVLCHYRPFHPSWLSWHQGEDHVIDADHSGRRDMEPSHLVSYSCSLFSWPVYWTVSRLGATDVVVWNLHWFSICLWSCRVLSYQLWHY